MRTSGEGDWLVACGELHVEPRDEGMYEVVASHGKAVGNVVCKLLLLHGVEVDRVSQAWLGDNSLVLDGVDEWLGKGDLLEWGEIEAVDVVPDWW